MRLLKDEHNLQVKVSIKRAKESPKEVVFVRTDIYEVETFVKSVLRKFCSPFAEGDRTSITIFNPLTGKNKSGRRFGVFGMDSKQVKEVLEEAASESTD